MTEPLRVLLVDDDPFTRVTLVTTLRSLGCTVVGDAESVSAGLRLSRVVQADVAVVDLDLGEGPTGIDLARRLRRDNPRLAIVMLSTYEEPRLMGHNQPALPEGTVYLVKRTITDPEVLERALHLAMNPDEQAQVRGNPRNAGGSALAGLSDQQIEIMRLIAAGLTNAEIAKRRVINERSVEKAIARLARHFDLPASRETNQRVLLSQMYFQLTGAVRARQP